MSFTNGKQFTVTEETVATYKRLRKRHQCSLCGHHFVSGDSARWIFANGTPSARTGNFFVCAACDSGTNDQIIERAKESLAQATKLAKQWDIYGPDWQDDWQRSERNAT